MASKQGRIRGLAAVIVLAGALVLVAAVLSPWYAFAEKFGGETVTTEYYPGLPTSNGTVRCSSNAGSGISHGNGTVSYNCGSTSYDQVKASEVGTLASAVFALAWLGGAVGILAALLGWIWRENSRRWILSVLVVMIALVASLVACVGYAAELPSGFAGDSPGSSGPGPWSTFSGSVANASTEISMNWGPAVGWYLSVGAGGVFFVALVLFFLGRNGPRAVRTSTIPPTSGAGGSPPPRVRIPVSHQKPGGDSCSTPEAPK